MNFLKIKKGDKAVYTVTLKHDQPKEQPPDSFGKKHYLYGVFHVDAQQEVLLDASETMHKKLSEFKKGDTVEIWYEYKDNKSFFKAQKIGTPAAKTTTTNNAPTQEQIAAQLPPTKDQKIEEMYRNKQDSIHVQSAIKMAIDTLSEKDKERTWNDISILLAERIRYFLKKIEGEVRAEVEEERIGYNEHD